MQICLGGGAGGFVEREFNHAGAFARVGSVVEDQHVAAFERAQAVLVGEAPLQSTQC